MMSIEDVRKAILNIKIDLYSELDDVDQDDDSLQAKLSCLDMAYDILCEYDNL